jgi:hypothetical protein
MLVVICISVASSLGLIDLNRPKTASPSRAGQSPETNITYVDGKRRLEIEIAFLEEMLRARRDKLAKFV